MNCPKCGIPVTPPSTRCPACGNALGGVEPTVVGAPSTITSEAGLAGRGERLVAQFLNGLLFMPVVAIFFVGGLGSTLMDTFSQSGELAPDLHAIFDSKGFQAAVVVFLGIIIAQVYFLSTRGQDIGKMALRIKIVKVSTGANGGFVTNFLLRSLANQIISSIPMIGFLYAALDILFIFRGDRRCLHDFLAGTRVVKA